MEFPPEWQQQWWIAPGEKSNSTEGDESGLRQDISPMFQNKPLTF